MPLPADSQTQIPQVSLLQRNTLELCELQSPSWNKRENSAFRSDSRTWVSATEKPFFGVQVPVFSRGLEGRACILLRA